MITKGVRKILYAVCAVICILVFGFIYLSERGKRQEVVEIFDEVPLNAAEAPVALSPTPTDAAKQEKIKIYIAGAVNAPGVYELDADSRVEEAVDAAGGAEPEADLMRINLAAHIKDGQQIIVPKQGEPVDKTYSLEENNTEENALININTASIEELMKLPNVGTVTAGNILAYREEHGDFQKIEDIQKVTRIGPKTFEKLKNLITVD
jgi:competence protein ComEA